MAGDDSAKRAEEEGNTQGCPGEHLSDLWVRLRSRLDEVRSEHDSCGLSVNQEVIKLDGRTHESSREHLAALLGIIRDDRSSHKTTRLSLHTRPHGHRGPWRSQRSCRNRPRFFSASVWGMDRLFDGVEFLHSQTGSDQRLNFSERRQKVGNGGNGGW